MPGAIVYVDVPGKGTWLTAFGSSTTEGAPPMSTDNHMRIGSVTKSLTAEVVLQLVDQGAIGLDDPVTKYLPGVPNGENITIRQLLGMTAGIFNFTEDDYFNLTLDKDPRKPWTPFECIGIGLAHPPYFPPGQGFHYSNTNYEILGVIAERVGKAPLQKLMQDLVFAKLGMGSTSLPVYDDTAIPDPHSQGYMYGTNVEGNVADNAALAGNKAAAQITVAPGTKPNDVTDLPSNGVASGAAISTVGDMVIWAKALGTGSLLTPATQAARTDVRPARQLRPRHGEGVRRPDRAQRGRARVPDVRGLSTREGCHRHRHGEPAAGAEHLFRRGAPRGRDRAARPTDGAPGMSHGLGRWIISSWMLSGSRKIRAEKGLVLPHR